MGAVYLYGWNSRISLAAHEALKDQGKTALVSHTRWESPRANPGRVTLPPTLLLSDFEPKCFIRAPVGHCLDRIDLLRQETDDKTQTSSRLHRCHARDA